MRNKLLLVGLFGLVLVIASAVPAAPALNDRLDRFESKLTTIIQLLAQIEGNTRRE